MPAPVMNAGFYLRNPQGKRRAVYGENGKKRWEKVPSSAGRTRRWQLMLRDDGHVVHGVLTSHAANLDLESSQANYYRRKWAKLGWLPVKECPVVSALSGKVNPRALCSEVQEAVEKNDACKHGSYSEDEPCRHMKMEMEVRRGRRAEEERLRAEAHESEQDRALRAQADTNAKLTEVLGELTTKKGRRKSGEE